MQIANAKPPTQILLFAYDLSYSFLDERYQLDSNYPIGGKIVDAEVF